MAMDELKARVAKAALEAAGAAIGDDLEETHMVELIQADPLVRQWRISKRTGLGGGQAPRYFVVQVKELI